LAKCHMRQDAQMGQFLSCSLTTTVNSISTELVTATAARTAVRELNTGDVQY